MIRASCAALLLTSSTALACWDSERVEWHAVSIQVDHGHETPSWSVTRAKHWAAYAAALGGPASFEPEDELPEPEVREVPIWTVQVFASSNEASALKALSAAEDLVPLGFYRVELHPGPVRQGEVREAVVRGRTIFQAITSAYATAAEAQRAIDALRAHGVLAFARKE